MTDETTTITPCFKLVVAHEGGLLSTPTMHFLRDHPRLYWTIGEWAEPLPLTDGDRIYIQYLSLRKYTHQLCLPGVLHALPSLEAVEHYLELEASELDPGQLRLYHAEIEGDVLRSSSAPIHKIGGKRMRLIGEPLPLPEPKFHMYMF